MEMNYHLLFKILLVGDVEVGRSALPHPTASETPSATPNIGVEFLKRTLEIERKKIKLQIWNVTGQESSQALTPSYYHGTLGFILVYDITDDASFNRISNWLSIIEQNASEKDFQKLLFANKSRCWCEELRTVTTERGELYAREHGMRFFESDNLDQAISLITQDILKKDQEQPAMKLLCDINK